jgi:hypothetical protein
VDADGRGKAWGYSTGERDPATMIAMPIKATAAPTRSDVVGA